MLRELIIELPTVFTAWSLVFFALYMLGWLRFNPFLLSFITLVAGTWMVYIYPRHMLLAQGTWVVRGPLLWAGDALCHWLPFLILTVRKGAHRTLDGTDVALSAALFWVYIGMLGGRPAEVYQVC